MDINTKDTLNMSHRIHVKFKKDIPNGDNIFFKKGKFYLARKSAVPWCYFVIDEQGIEKSVNESLFVIKTPEEILKDSAF